MITVPPKIEELLPPWSPSLPPIYNISLSYQENLENGPFFSKPIPKRSLPPKKNWTSFLGHPVASRIGVPAGPLLSSSWTTFAAQMGYDIVTYKTIRSSADPGHPLPNILYTECDKQLQAGALPPQLPASTHPPAHLEQLGITNSFGMPSQGRSFLEKDLPAAQQALQKGQALVVSITGSPSETCSLEEDFAAAAQLALDCGAKILEANFSCPNVASKEGSLYLSPKDAAQVASTIKRTAGDIPLIIKVGHFSQHTTLEELFTRLSDAGVDAISGINTLSLRITDKAGNPALGPNRPTSGVCGAPIFNAALNFVRSARETIDSFRLPLTLIGVGGAMQPEQLQSLLSSGADFAQTATGMMWDPYLALRFHQKNQKAQ